MNKKVKQLKKYIICVIMIVGLLITSFTMYKHQSKVVYENILDARCQITTNSEIFTSDIINFPKSDNYLYIVKTKDYFHLIDKYNNKYDNPKYNTLMRLDPGVIFSDNGEEFAYKKSLVLTTDSNLSKGLNAVTYKGIESRGYTDIRNIKISNDGKNIGFLTTDKKYNDQLIINNHVLYVYDEINDFIFTENGDNLLLSVTDKGESFYIKKSLPKIVNNRDIDKNHIEGSGLKKGDIVNGIYMGSLNKGEINNGVIQPGSLKNINGKTEYILDNKYISDGEVKFDIGKNNTNFLISKDFNNYAYISDGNKVIINGKEGKKYKHIKFVKFIEYNEEFWYLAINDFGEEIIVKNGIELHKYNTISNISYNNINNTFNFVNTDKDGKKVIISNNTISNSYKNLVTLPWEESNLIYTSVLKENGKYIIIKNGIESKEFNFLGKIKLHKKLNKFVFIGDKKNLYDCYY